MDDKEKMHLRIKNPQILVRNCKFRTVDYIHFNPVRNGLVEHPEEYLLSSAKDFLNKRKGILKLSFING